jgi:biopolymer transport protein ExbB
MNLQQTAYDLWSITARGGWVMGAIFVAGQVGWLFVVERWWHFRKLGGKRGLRSQVLDAVTGARASGQEAMIAKAREALQRGVPALSRHLGTIAVIAGAAPLLGLTGTVAGIMETFRVITLYGAGNPSMMAGGIAQALMVTEAGLVVAFPLLLCHDWLQKQADRIEDDCVEDATRKIREFSGGARLEGGAA